MAKRMKIDNYCQQRRVAIVTVQHYVLFVDLP